MTTPTSQAAFELQVGPYTGRDLTVASFRGHEAISRLFRFDVVVTNVGDQPIDGSLVGRPAALIMHVDEGTPRVVRGLAASVERAGHDRTRAETRFRLRLVPRLWLLRRRRRSRIFQDKTVVAIVDAVLAEYKIATRWNLARTPQVRAYCVQHQETDFAFVTRLLAEDGILFWFAPSLLPASLDDLTLDPASWSEVVHFSDAATYPSLDLTLIHREAEGLRPSREFAFGVAVRRSVRHDEAVVRDFDFTNPALFPTDRADCGQDQEPVTGIAQGQLEHYEHHGDYDRPEVTEGRAAEILEQLRRRAIVGRGASWCHRLLAGHQFTLEEHVLDDLDGAYAITRITHEGKAPERMEGGREQQIYENRFECVPADVPYRPRRARRAVKQVTETAIVVGPAGQEIHTDAAGRVKVRFHWDLEGAGDEGSSCWIRVAQAWAGAGWGFQFIPRVGMEVLVTFLGGDTDRPVITGCLFNAVNPPSHSLPRWATKSGIRTRTSPGQTNGFNELSFEDQLGAEMVYLHAERDLSEVVEHEHKMVVGRWDPAHPVGCQSIQVAETQTVRIGVNQVVTVGGDRDDTVEGARTERVGQGRTLRVEGTHEQWDGQEFAHHVALGHVHTVGADLESRVAGHVDLTTGGGVLCDVGGDHTLAVRGSLAVSARSGGAIDAREGLTLSSATFVRLTCGESSIELLPDEIIVSSPTITLLGAKSVCAHGEESVLLLDKKATLVSGEVTVSGKDTQVLLEASGVRVAAKKNVALYSKGASVVLDSDASIDGAKVKLNCGGDSQGEYDEPDTIEASYVDLYLTRKAPKEGDPSQLEDVAVGGARFVVEAGDGRIFQGVLDGGGRARVPVPKGEVKVTFPGYDKGRVKAK